MPDHEVIYLIPGDFDGAPAALWCDEPAPSDDHDETEAIKYMRVKDDKQMRRDIWDYFAQNHGVKLVEHEIDSIIKLVTV